MKVTYAQVNVCGVWTKQEAQKVKEILREAVRQIERAVLVDSDDVDSWVDEEEREDEEE